MRSPTYKEDAEAKANQCTLQFQGVVSGFSSDIADENLI